MAQFHVVDFPSASGNNVHVEKNISRHNLTQLKIHDEFMMGSSRHSHLQFENLKTNQP